MIHSFDGAITETGLVGLFFAFLKLYTAISFVASFLTSLLLLILFPSECMIVKNNDDKNDQMQLDMVKITLISLAIAIVITLTVWYAKIR